MFTAEMMEDICKKYGASPVHTSVMLLIFRRLQIPPTMETVNILRAIAETLELLIKDREALMNQVDNAVNN